MDWSKKMDGVRNTDPDPDVDMLVQENKVMNSNPDLDMEEAGKIRAQKRLQSYDGQCIYGGIEKAYNVINGPTRKSLMRYAKMI